MGGYPCASLVRRYDAASKATESGAPLPDFAEFAAQAQIPGNLPHTPPAPVTDALEAELLGFLALDPQHDGEERHAYLKRVFSAAQAARITPRWDRASELGRDLVSSCHSHPESRPVSA